MGQQLAKQPQGTRLFMRSLVPTAIGAIWYLLLGLILTSLHLLGMSVSGTAYPASFDDQLLQGYANAVIQPLATIVNNATLNSSLSLVLWGITGWVFCWLMACMVGMLNEWRDTKDDINIPHEGVVVPHPLLRSFFVRSLVRLGIGICLVLLTIMLLPIMRVCFDNDGRILDSVSYLDALSVLVTNILIWMMVFHAYVVLLRLYMFRTRLSKEKYFN